MIDAPCGIDATPNALVLKAPAQYLWAHRRFKTLPPGAREVYYDS